MKYKLDKWDRGLLRDCRKAVEYDDDGCPMKDVLDEDDFESAIRLLVAIVDTEEQK